VREALFGILSSAGAIHGASVLDLYAGTGALAFEALSRGAARATLVESAAQAVAAIHANVVALGLADRVRVIVADVRSGARRWQKAGPFDLVLADPPWALVDSGEVPRALAELGKAGVLTPSALVVVEHATRSHPFEVEGLTRGETRPYGDSALTFYKPAILDSPRQGDARSPPE
jgi:16S rRNA (guanine966-N2)-methyltransferase